MDLVRMIYKVTQTFPREELYGLTGQLRRAAVSIPSNIAEGQARYSCREFHHFLSHARGSLVEIETQLLIAEDLGCEQHTFTAVAGVNSGTGPNSEPPCRFDQSRSLASAFN